MLLSVMLFNNNVYVIPVNESFISECRSALATLFSTVAISLRPVARSL